MLTNIAEIKKPGMTGLFKVRRELLLRCTNNFDVSTAVLSAAFSSCIACNWIALAF